MANDQVQYTLSLNDLMSSKLQTIEGNVNGLEGSINKVQKTLMSFGAAVGIGFGVSAIAAFGQKVLQAGTYVENTQTGLTTLLKDAAAAKQVIANTQADAQATPFSFESLITANKALISANVSAQDARQTVLDLSNAIAATGGGDAELSRMVVNLQQIKNVGKASALDIKQFAYAGINVYQLLANQMGVNVDKVKGMEVSYETLAAALKKAHEAGGLYANGLENASQNTSIKISNLGDGVYNLSVRIFNDLKPAIDTVIKGLASMVTIAGEAWTWIEKNGTMLKELAITAGIAAAAFTTYSIAMRAAEIWTGLMTAAQWALNAAMTANPVGLVIAGIAAIVAAVVVMWNKWAGFRAFLYASWAVIKEIGSLIKDYFVGLKDVIVGTFTLDKDQVVRGMNSMASATFGAGKRLADAAKDGWKEGMASFAEDQKKNETTNSPAAPPKPGKPGTAAIPTKQQTKGAQGSKIMTINVTIGNLIKDFTIKTTNVQESAQKIHEIVAGAMVAALNDSQRIGG